MKALIIATGECPDLTLLNERYPAPMLPLVDRPFIQHVVESLIDQGITEFDLILRRMPEDIERLFGNGARWGSVFRFHLARDVSHAGRLLKRIITGNGSEPVLVGHADRLPQLQLKHAPSPQGPDTPLVFCWRQGGEPGRLEWSGWARVSGRFIAGLPDELDEDVLGAQLISLAPGEETLIEVPKPLSVRSYEEILASHWRLLSQEVPGVVFSARETDKGIWISRNVSLHRTARLVPPVYIAENCKICAGVRLGPNVAVGKNCMLDSHSIVANSVVFPGSYVGEMTEVTDAIVDKNCLVNVRVGAAVQVVDDFILGSMSERRVMPWLGGLLARLGAIALLLLTWPVLLLTALWLIATRTGPVLHRTEVVRLPTTNHEAEWQTFLLWSFSPESLFPASREPRTWEGLRHLFLHFLPALVNIARGELRFVGVTPRSREAVSALPRDWQALYLRAKAGILTEAYIVYGASPTADEFYAAEAFYSVSAGIRHDLGLLFKYLLRVFKLTGPHWR